jgi:excisionase family DNA binding protein
MTDEEDLLDIGQAAEFLNVSETSLRRWTNSGRLACMRVGSRRERRFRKSDLLALLESEPSSAGLRSARGTSPAEQVVIGGLSVPYGTHLCGFFASDEGRVRLAAGFLSDGLRLGTVCFLVAPKAMRDEIVNELGTDRALVESHIANGTLVLGEYAKSVAGQLQYFEDLLVAALAGGAHAFRVVGHLQEFYRRIGAAAVLEYEAAYEQRIARRFPVVTMCLYDARAFTGVELLGALKQHPDSLRYPAERWTA